MRLFVTLADYVADNHDGTVTVVRAGVNRVSTRPDPPLIVRGGLWARLDFESGDRGDHTVCVGLFDDKEQAVTGSVRAPMKASEDMGFFNVVFNFALPVERPGRYAFHIVVDDTLKASVPLEVEGAT